MKRLPKIGFIFLLSLLLVSCTKERNHYRQITDGEELKVRAVTHIAQLFPNQGTNNTNGHLVPKDGIGFIFFTPESFNITETCAPNCPLWFGLPIGEPGSYAIDAAGTTCSGIDPGTNKIKDKSFSVCAKGFILLEGTYTSFRIRNHFYLLSKDASHNSTGAPADYGYFYVINSNGNILIGLTKDASTNLYKEVVSLPGTREYNSEITLIWQEEANRRKLVSVSATFINSKNEYATYGNAYLKDNSTIILQRDAKSKDEVEVNLTNDTWKYL